MSSISRAFTTRRNKKPADMTAPLPKRSLTGKQSVSTIRNNISGPMALISTTNMLSYSAPDIFPSNISSTSSRTSNSDDDSERSAAGASSPLTSPDSSSIESSPTSPEPNHLSCYFGKPSRESNSSEDAPVIPQRALSHTKKTAEILARKRSISRMSASKNSISSTRSAPHNSLSLSTGRSSMNHFTANCDTVAESPHPFGPELAQVSEIAEEYGISKERMVVDEEEQELISRGYFKFCAEDYMSEIQGLFRTAFTDSVPRPAVWI